MTCVRKPFDFKAVTCYLQNALYAEELRLPDQF